MNKEYIDKTYYEATLKQKLAALIGREFNNLSSLSIKDLLHEVEVQGKEYVDLAGSCKILHRDVEDAQMYVNTGYPFN